MLCFSAVLAACCAGHNLKSVITSDILCVSCCSMCTNAAGILLGNWQTSEPIEHVHVHRMGHKKLCTAGKATLNFL